MEVFLVAGMNSMPPGVSKIADRAKEIGPDRIQLNTSVRPPAEDFATALSEEQMQSRCSLFDPTAEIIAEFKAQHASPIQANQATIFSMLQRRPCTAEQIADIFSMHLNEVSKYLGKLMRADLIRAQRESATVYYAATKRKAD
jgi:wyosine [tRNA(Phe)-imidazoG37] synthetase (radical SAM superfamily)